MNKFILRIALFLGLFLTVFSSPALAAIENYVTFDLTIKTSQYRDAHGKVAYAQLNAQTPNPGAYGTSYKIHIDSEDHRETGNPSTLQIYAQPDPGYRFVRWADADSKTTLPAAASTEKVNLYSKRIYRYLTNATESSVQFQFIVDGTFIIPRNYSHTLFAVFEPATYTVNFNAKEGTVSPDSKEVTYNEIYGVLPTPEKVGYVFAGWYLDENCTTSPVSSNTKCTTPNNHNLYAKWTAIQHTIHFVDQEQSQSFSDAIYSGTSMPTLPTSGGYRPVITDKYFAGFYTKPNGLGTRVYAGYAEGDNLKLLNPLTLTEDITLYAHYSHTHHRMYWDYSYDMGYDPLHAEESHFRNLEDGIKYARLTFKKADGTVIKTIIMTATTPTEMPIETMTNDFSTHTKSRANINLRVGSTDDVLNVEDVLVYFTDDQLASFASYTFEAISTTAATPEEAIVANNWMVTTDKTAHHTVLTFTGAELTNLFMQNWSVKLKDLKINPDLIYVMPLFENETGNWEAISQLAFSTGVPCAKVSEEDGVATYNGNYPIWIINTTNDYYNNAIGLVGFKLGGKDYFMNTEHPGAFEPFYNSATVAAPFVVNPGTNTGETPATVINMTVPASQIPVIRFLTAENDAELSPATPAYLVKAYGEQIDNLNTSYTATRPGFEFTGWKEGNGTAIPTPMTVERAYTVYAQWRGAQYNVTIHKNGGEGDDFVVTPRYLGDMPSIESNLPTRTGYNFAGCWDINDHRYYDADGTSHQPYNKKEDSELWVGWTPKTYTVTLDPNGGMSPASEVTATYGEALPTVFAPTSSAFLGYFDSPTMGAGTMYINADGVGTHAWDKDVVNPTLYAHWMTSFYTVTYHANHTDAGGTDYRVRYFDPEDNKTWKAGVYVGMTIPVGKRFMGWTTNADGTGEFYKENDAITLTGEGLHLYAKWADGSDKYTIWYGKGTFNTTDWKYLEFTQSKSGDHHVWESGHLEITEDFKINDDQSADEMHYFVVAAGHETHPTDADIARRKVMGTMGVAPCHEEDGTCLRTIHDIILPEDDGDPETSDRAGVYGHFHIWTSHTAECNFACHMVRDFFLDYHSNFPFGLPDRTYEQIVEFETGHTIIKGNEYHMSDFPQGLLTFRNWNTKPDGTGTTYHPGDIFTFPADSTHNIRLYAQWEIDETQAEHFVVHQTGSHYGTLLDNGMQRVHTYERTIYINETDSLQLYRPDYSTYREYVRWYNFNTDHACPNLKFQAGSFGASRNFQNQQGRFLTNQNNQGEVKFVAPADFNTNSNYQNGIDVACDQSAYTDGRFLSFGFQYSRMVWYFFGFDVADGDPANVNTVWSNPRKLTKADLDAMKKDDVKYIYIVKPNNGGFVWFWSGNHNGATINPISDSGIAAKVEECRTIHNRTGYRMKLTKVDDGAITIQTLSNQGDNHVGKYLTITADKHYTFQKDSSFVWYYSNPGRDINETNLGSIDGSRNNTSLLYLRDKASDYLYTNPAGWGNVAGSVAAKLPSGTNTVGNTEPTLSQRLLFHIKPATIMVDSMEKYISTIVGDKYMEEIRMIAPTRQTIWAGPSLQYKTNSDFDYHAHTYFFDNNGTPTPCTDDNGTWQWKRNGVDFTPDKVATGRFAKLEKGEPEVNSPTITASGEVTYTLQYTARETGRIYNVCRIVVDYQKRDVVGPSHELGYSAVANAMRVAYEDFNINPRTGRFVGNAETHNFNGTTDVRFYTRALPYEESAYGFYDGSRTIAHYAGGSRRWFPFWGEYGLVSNSATGWGVNNMVANHDETAPNGQNRESGYSIYIDGSAIPGEVFELNVDNLKLCANSKMYCSAWVASLTQSPYTKPNFDFEVFAYNKSTGEEHIVTTYTTGELAYNPADPAPHPWQHILFPVTYRGEVGAVGEGNVQFRVRIINKGENSRGNDFMIDDIGFFVKQPDFKAIQANTTSCLQTGQEERMPLYLRVDYEQLVASDPSNPHMYYYAWFDEKHQAVVADTDEGYFWLDGLEPDEAEITAGADTTKMGKIALSASISGKPQYNSFKEFDQHITQQLTAGTLRAQRAYVKEKGKDNLDHYFLYIVQPLTVKANHTYHAAMSTDINNVVAGHSHEDPCTMVTHLDIIAGARIRVDGEVFTHESDICGNRTYTLDIEMNYIMKNDAGNYETKTIYCNADWLKGNDSVIVHNKELYGVAGLDSVQACDTIIHAIIASHSATEAENYEYTEARQNIVKHLVDNGLLTQNVPKFVFHPTSSDSHYMAFARGDGSSEHAHICPEPQEIFFNFPEEYNHGVIIGNATENAPLSVIENPRVIRVQHNVINQGGMFSFPLYQAVGEDQSALDGFVITAAESIERNASGLPQYVLSAKTVSNDGHRTNVGSVPAGGCIVELRGACLNDIKEGEYNFALLMEVPSTLAENACDIRYAFFKLIVTPDILSWNPTVSIWNADNSWNDFGHTEYHYVPLPTTQVIMPAEAKTVPLPIKADTIESGAQNHIVFDIYGDTKNDSDFYYRPYSCSDIYFPVGASLMNQSTLNIGGQAFIDVAYTANKWQLTSFPIHGVVSGDIFIPELGDNPGTTKPFEIKEISENTEDRWKHLFYQNFYNASVTNTTGSGSCQETVESSTWLSSAQGYGDDHTSGYMANGAAIPYGYVADGQVASALWLSTTDNNTTLRLPKKADVTYQYFDKTTKEWISYLSDVITRSDNDNYAKPAYTTSGQTFTLRGHGDSQIFLFGNPTFAYIDMKKFIAANKYDEVNNPTGTLSGTCYRLNGTNYVASIEEVNADGSTNYFLPPYSAVLVQAKTADITADVIITDDMLVATPPAQDPAPAPHRQAASSDSQADGLSTIFISATSGDFTTYAMAEEKADATNLYDESEDADVFMMAEAQTPFVIYTAADKHALAINRHRSLDYLPLSLFSNKVGVAQKVRTTLVFNGDDTYLREWDIVLLGTPNSASLKDGRRVTLDMYTDGTPTAALVHTRRVTTAITNTSSDALHVYAFGGNVFCCADHNMHHIEVISPSGQLLCTADEVGTYYEMNLAPGVYLVRVDGQAFKVFND